MDESKLSPKEQVEYMLQRAKILEEQKQQKQKEEKEKFIPVVAVEEQHLPDLLTPVTSLNLFEDEIDTEQTILSKFKVDEDAYKGVNITPEKVKKVKKSLGRMTTGVAAAVPLQCRAEHCQPPGSLVLTTKGEKRIEELDPATDLVVSYDVNNKSVVKRGKNFKLGSKLYAEDLHVFEDVENTSTFKTTYDHILLAKLNEGSIGKYCVYMMQKGDNFRIGVTIFLSEQSPKLGRDKKTYRRNIKLGIKNRFNAERADKLWILAICETKVDAFLKEEFFTCKFGVPQSLFISCAERGRPGKYNGKSKWVSQEQIDEHFESLKQPLEIMKHHLKSIGRDYDYPFLNRTDLEARKNIQLSAIFEVRACNYLPEVMLMPTFDNYRTEKDIENIDRDVHPDYKYFKVSKELYRGSVYYLDVEKYHTYITNGVITHNCSYSQTCLTGDTLILTSTFKEVPLKDINVGDKIYSANKDYILERQTVTNKICNGEKYVYKLTTKSDKVLKLTANHKVASYLDNEIRWIALEDGLQIGHKVLVVEDLEDNSIFTDNYSDFLIDEIVDIEELGLQVVYDIEVENNHNFIASSVLCHNCVFFKEDIHVEGEPCLAEVYVAEYWTKKYMEDLNIDPNSITEVHTVSRLVEISILENRLTQYMSIHQPDLTMDVVTAVGDDGDPIYNKASSIAFEQRERLDRSKLKILESLAATREKKMKIQISAQNTTNATSSLASVKNSLEALAEDLKRMNGIKTVNQ